MYCYLCTGKQQGVHRRVCTSQVFILRSVHQVFTWFDVCITHLTSGHEQQIYATVRCLYSMVCHVFHAQTCNMCTYFNTIKVRTRTSSVHKSGVFALKLRSVFQVVPLKGLTHVS